MELVGIRAAETAADTASTATKGVQTAATVAGTSATTAQVAATTEATVAQTGLNTAMAANPIGLVVGQDCNARNSNDAIFRRNF